MKKEGNYYQKRIVILATLIFIFTLFVFPLILQCPFVKQIVITLLSFTENKEYKAAYVEFIGAIIGSFIAICGSVWIQAKVDEQAERNKIKKYACIVYNDLDLAFKDLIKIFGDVEIRQFIKEEDEVTAFYHETIGRKIHLSPNWISDVAQLNNVLSRTEIQTIYQYYGVLVEIDYALQSRKLHEIKGIYDSHIECLFDRNHMEVNSECKYILDLLFSLTES